MPQGSIASYITAICNFAREPIQPLETWPLKTTQLLCANKHQWEFQDPKMEVLYHMFGHILWGYPLT